jgi:Protein of unknown function (DUF3768)
MNKTIKIRALNDALRAIAAGNGRIYVTAGIAALPMQDQVEIMSRVREFADFTADNDPYGQHDFGSRRPVRQLSLGARGLPSYRRGTPAARLTRVRQAARTEQGNRVKQSWGD